MFSRLSLSSSSEVDRPGRYEVEIRHVDDPHESGFLPCQRRHIKQPLCEKWALRSYWRTVMQKIKGYLAWKSIIFEHLPNNSDFFAIDIIYLGNLDVSVLLPCQSRYIQLWHGRIWGLSSHIWWRTVAHSTWRAFFYGRRKKRIRRMVTTSFKSIVLCFFLKSIKIGYPPTPTICSSTL